MPTKRKAAQRRKRPVISPALAEFMLRAGRAYGASTTPTTARKRKAKPKGLVLESRSCSCVNSCGLHIFRIPGRSQVICHAWARALRRAGWRPTKNPAKWRFWCERVEDK